MRRALLSARGWASCWMDIMDDPEKFPDSTPACRNNAVPTLGHMRGICEKIDIALEILKRNETVKGTVVLSKPKKTGGFV